MINASQKMDHKKLGKFLILNSGEAVVYFRIKTSRYIKKNKLNKGRTIHPDAKLKKVLPANSLSMFKIAGSLVKGNKSGL